MVWDCKDHCFKKPSPHSQTWILSMGWCLTLQLPGGHSCTRRWWNLCNTYCVWLLHCRGRSWIWKITIFQNDNFHAKFRCFLREFHEISWYISWDFLMYVLILCFLGKSSMKPWNRVDVFFLVFPLLGCWWFSFFTGQRHKGGRSAGSGALA